MKKNVFAITIILVVLLLSLFLINLFRNYYILNKICNSNNEFKDSLSNYHYTINFDFTKGDLKNLKEEVYCYNGIYLVKIYIDNSLDSILWFDTNSGESAGINKTTEENINNINIEYYTNMYKNVLLTGNIEKNNAISKILIQNLFKAITIKDKSYIINFDNSEIFINKDSKLIQKNVSGDVITTNSIEKNSLTADDVNIELIYH